MNQQHILEALGGLGVSNELMQQLRERLTPAPVLEKPSKRLMDLEHKLDKIKMEKVRLHSIWPKKKGRAPPSASRAGKQRKGGSKKWLVRLLGVSNIVTRPSHTISVGSPNTVEVDDAYLGLNHPNVQNSGLAVQDE